MAHSIPQDKIDEVRDATDITELVSDYVTLKRKGQNLFGLCPFHNEKTPSFSVYPEKQIFHCFGCGAGGNAFTFLMRLEGIGFPDAVKYLARKIGLELDYEPVDTEGAKENEALYHINEFAADFFQKQLFDKTGSHALKYITARGFDEEDVRRFGLGYAPPGWDTLLKETKRTANDESVLLRAGLIIENESGRRYDRFRDRLIFPIRNLSGRVVAFGGRILQQDPDSPKYINSPETTVYEKSKILYGLYQNRDEVRKTKEAVFVEGYMDLLSLTAKGIKNVVATSGTSLTEDQTRLIKRYTDRAVLMYDSDAAGVAATMRGADILLAGGLDVRLVTLPQGQDPDSFVREAGPAALTDKIAKAPSIFDFKLSQVVETAVDKRGEGINDILGSLARVKDQIKRSLLVSSVATRLGLEEKLLWAKLQEVAHKERRPVARRMTVEGDSRKSRKRTLLEKATEDLIGILLRDWELAEFVFENIDETEVQACSKVEIFTYFKNHFKGGKRPVESALLSHFNNVELSEFLVGEISKDMQDINLMQCAFDCMKAIKIENLQRQIEATRQRLKENISKDQTRSDLKKCKELEAQKQRIAALQPA